MNSEQTSVETLIIEQNTKKKTINWIFFYHAEDKTNLYYGHIGLRSKTGFGVKGLQMEFTDL